MAEEEVVTVRRKKTEIDKALTLTNQELKSTNIVKLKENKI